MRSNTLYERMVKEQFNDMSHEGSEKFGNKLANDQAANQNQIQAAHIKLPFLSSLQEVWI